MSTTPKLPGGKSNDTLTRFKFYWRDELPDAQREFWRARFHSKDTQAAIREEIRTKLKFDLRYDKQLTSFRKWDEMQQAMDEEAQQQADDERRLIAEHGDSLTKEQLRDKVLLKSYARTLATGDYKLGLQTMDRDLSAQKVSIDREKLELMKSKADAYDDAKGVMENKELTMEQREARMRECFGISK